MTMVRKALIGALAAGALIATPVIASAEPAGTAGTPTITAAALVRPGTADPGGSTSPTTSTVPGAPAADSGTPSAGGKAGHPTLRWLLRHHGRLAGVLHVQWTGTAKDGTFVTHDAIHGTVDAVAAGSVTVSAADHTTQTYRTSDDTAVWKVVEQNGKRRLERGSMTDVVAGATVVVGGTGTTEPYVARRILVQPAG
jgi:hypothetical protein